MIGGWERDVKGGALWNVSSGKANPKYDSNVDTVRLLYLLTCIV
jgi:hypothetical protein